METVKELVIGRYYFMTKHREESWIIKVNAIGSSSIHVDGISPGKKTIVRGWVVEKAQKERVFVEADSDQIRHIVSCLQIGIYRSKPSVKNMKTNSYDIC